MIENKEVSLPITEHLTSVYIESSLKNMGFNVLRWAIVDVKNDNYILNVSVVE